MDIKDEKNNAEKNNGKLSNDSERYTRRAYELTQQISENEQSIASEVNQSFEEVQSLILNELETISSHMALMQASLNEALNANVDLLGTQQKQGSSDPKKAQ